MDPFAQISVDSRREATMAQQLKQQLAWLMASGDVQPGQQLPPVRQMAQRLGINLHTVRSAYHKLEADGLVETRRGRGTHALPFDPRRMAERATALRSHTIGVIVPSWNNPFYHALLQGIEEIAEEDQTLLFLCNTHDDPNTAWRDFARLAAKQVDGVLVASHDIGQFLEPESGGDSRRAQGLPYVTVDWPDCRGYCALVDLQMAGYQATHHLLEHGHRRIGLITFSGQAANTAAIEAGYRRALTEAGVEGMPEWIARVQDFSLVAGAQGAGQLLALPEPPGAFFAVADTLALGAMDAIKKAGLEIPAQVALVGFNDIPLAGLVQPPLTSVRAPAIELGRQAMNMLRSLIAGERPPQRRVVLPTALVARGSCGEHGEYGSSG